MNAEALIFSKQNDTLSILQYLRDNVDIPVMIENAGVNRLLDSIDSEDPVIVFVPADAFDVSQLGFFGTSMFHCVVVAGYNEDKSRLYFYSDGKGPFELNLDTFSDQWTRVENLCIIRSQGDGE